MLQEYFDHLLRWMEQAALDEPLREGLQDTPRRMEKAYKELTSGYSGDAEFLLKQGSFTAEGKGMVVVANIPFFSLCEHHCLPFFGTASVGYLPSEKIVGLSKIPRLLEIYSRRLQVQERLTKQVMDELDKALEPKGTMVVIRASHLCMAMRGVQKLGSFTTTSECSGLFREPAVRNEFFQLEKQ